jgi:hypothetical protein
MFADVISISMGEDENSVVLSYVKKVGHDRAINIIFVCI